MFPITLPIRLDLLLTSFPILVDFKSISSNKLLNSSSLACPSVDSVILFIASSKTSISKLPVSIDFIKFENKYFGSKK